MASAALDSKESADGTAACGRTTHVEFETSVNEFTLVVILRSFRIASPVLSRFLQEKLKSFYGEEKWLAKARSTVRPRIRQYVKEDDEWDMFVSLEVLRVNLQEMFLREAADIDDPPLVEKERLDKIRDEIQTVYEVRTWLFHATRVSVREAFRALSCLARLWRRFSLDKTQSDRTAKLEVCFSDLNRIRHTQQQVKQEMGIMSTPEDDQLSTSVNEPKPAAVGKTMPCTVRARCSEQDVCQIALYRTFILLETQLALLLSSADQEAYENLLQRKTSDLRPLDVVELLKLLTNENRSPMPGNLQKRDEKTFNKLSTPMRTIKSMRDKQAHGIDIQNHEVLKCMKTAHQILKLYRNDLSVENLQVISNMQQKFRSISPIQKSVQSDQRHKSGKHFTGSHEVPDSQDRQLISIELVVRMEPEEKNWWPSCRDELIGRGEVIRELLALLHLSSPRVLVHGQHGVGKTALVRALAARLRDKYPIQYNFQASSNASLAADLFAFLTAEEIPTTPGNDLLETAKDCLAACSQSMLLVFDDVEDPGVVWDMLPTDKHAVIFISQNEVEWQQRNLIPSCVPSVVLQPITTDESMQLVGTIITKQCKKEDVERYLQLCQSKEEVLKLQNFVETELSNLPLAVHLMARVLAFKLNSGGASLIMAISDLVGDEEEVKEADREAGQHTSHGFRRIVQHALATIREEEVTLVLCLAASLLPSAEASVLYLINLCKWMNTCNDCMLWSFQTLLRIGLVEMTLSAMSFGMHHLTQSHVRKELSCYRVARTVPNYLALNIIGKWNNQGIRAYDVALGSVDIWLTHFGVASPQSSNAMIQQYQTPSNLIRTMQAFLGCVGFDDHYRIDTVLYRYVLVINQGLQFAYAWRSDYTQADVLAFANIQEEILSSELTAIPEEHEDEKLQFFISAFHYGHRYQQRRHKWAAQDFSAEDIMIEVIQLFTEETPQTNEMTTQDNIHVHLARVGFNEILKLQCLLFGAGILIQKNSPSSIIDLFLHLDLSPEVLLNTIHETQKDVKELYINVLTKNHLLYYMWALVLSGQLDECETLATKLIAVEEQKDTFTSPTINQITLNVLHLLAEAFCNTKQYRRGLEVCNVASCMFVEDLSLVLPNIFCTHFAVSSLALNCLLQMDYAMSIIAEQQRWLNLLRTMLMFEGFPEGLLEMACTNLLELLQVCITSWSSSSKLSSLTADLSDLLVRLLARFPDTPVSSQILLSVVSITYSFVCEASFIYLFKRACLSLDGPMFSAEYAQALLFLIMLLAHWHFLHGRLEVSNGIYANALFIADIFVLELAIEACTKFVQPIAAAMDIIVFMGHSLCPGMITKLVIICQQRGKQKVANCLLLQYQQFQLRTTNQEALTSWIDEVIASMCTGIELLQTLPPSGQSLVMSSLFKRQHVNGHPGNSSFQSCPDPFMNALIIWKVLLALQMGKSLEVQYVQLLIIMKYVRSLSHAPPHLVAYCREDDIIALVDNCLGSWPEAEARQQYWFREQSSPDDILIELILFFQQENPLVCKHEKLQVLAVAGEAFLLMNTPSAFLDLLSHFDLSAHVFLKELKNFKMKPTHSRVQMTTPVPNVSIEGREAAKQNAMTVLSECAVFSVKCQVLCCTINCLAKCERLEEAESVAVMLITIMKDMTLARTVYSYPVISTVFALAALFYDNHQYRRAVELCQNVSHLFALELCTTPALENICEQLFVVCLALWCLVMGARGETRAMQHHQWVDCLAAIVQSEAFPELLVETACYLILRTLQLCGDSQNTSLSVSLAVDLTELLNELLAQFPNTKIPSLLLVHALLEIVGEFRRPAFSSLFQKACLSLNGSPHGEYVEAVFALTLILADVYGQQGQMDTCRHLGDHALSQAARVKLELSSGMTGRPLTTTLSSTFLLPLHEKLDIVSALSRQHGKGQLAKLLHRQLQRIHRDTSVRSDGTAKMLPSEGSEEVCNPGRC